jgi:hypothetical protein
MVRKGIVVGVVALLPLGAHTASAVTMYDTSGASITCNTMVGVAKIRPSLTFSPLGPSAIKLKATLTDCYISGTVTPASPPLEVYSGKLSGTLTDQGLGCLGFGGSGTVDGSVTVKWKTNGKVLDSVLTPGILTEGTIDIPDTPPNASYAALITGGSVSGGFAAGVPNFFLVASETLANFVTQCAGPKGLKVIHIGVGQLTL